MPRAVRVAFAAVLFVLAVCFGGGVLLGATHLAAATFLTVSALFLGSIAGLVLLYSAVRVPGSGWSRALLSVSGLLLVGSVFEVMIPQLGAVQHVGVPMFFGGAILGIPAIALGAQPKPAEVLIPAAPYEATAERAVVDPVPPREQ